MMVFVDKVLEKWIGHEGQKLSWKVRVLVKETLASSSAPSTKWGHSKKSPSVNQQQAFVRHGICQCLHLGLPSLHTMRNPVVHKPLVCSILLQQPRWTKRRVTSQRAWDKKSRVNQDYFASECQSTKKALLLVRFKYGVWGKCRVSVWGRGCYAYAGKSRAG